MARALAGRQERRSARSARGPFAAARRRRPTPWPGRRVRRQRTEFVGSRWAVRARLSFAAFAAHLRERRSCVLAKPSTPQARRRARTAQRDPTNSVRWRPNSPPGPRRRAPASSRRKRSRADRAERRSCRPASARAIPRAAAEPACGRCAATRGAKVRCRSSRRPRPSPAAKTLMVRSMSRSSGLGDNLTLRFPFAAPTPAAMFRRADTLWLVFDTEAPIATRALEIEPSGTIKSVALTRQSDVTVVRIKLERPRLASVSADGPVWTVTLGSEIVEPTRPLALSRNIVAPARSSVIIPIEDGRRLHRLEDPEAGDTLLVVTALAPARGIIKTQDFVEFRALASTHGVVLQPLADDLNAELAADKLVITRQAGLTLSPAAGNGASEPSYRRYVLDAETWGVDRDGNFGARKSALIEAAAAAPEISACRRAWISHVSISPTTWRLRPRRCSISRSRPTRRARRTPRRWCFTQSPASWPDARSRRSRTSTIRSSATSTVRRCGGPLPWRGSANGRTLARVFAMSRRPWRHCRSNCSGPFMTEMTRAFVEVGDITGGVNQLHEFETVGIPRELEPAMSCSRPDRRRARAVARRAAGLSDRGGFLGSPGRGAGPFARDRAPPGNRRSHARRCHQRP